jgi:hypothetical protein
LLVRARNAFRVEYAEGVRRCLTHSNHCQSRSSDRAPSQFANHLRDRLAPRSASARRRPAGRSGP